MALFTSWSLADLANPPKVERSLAKLEIGAKVDMGALWNLFGAYQVTLAQEAGAKQIRDRLTEIMLEIIQRCTNKYRVRVYNDSTSFQFDVGQDVKAELSDYINKVGKSRGDWCGLISSMRVYIGQCMVCGANESVRMPTTEEIVFTSRQLTENKTLHTGCQDKVKCAHCEERLGEFQEVVYAQWAQTRLCPICFTSSRELIEQPKGSWKQLRDRRRVWIS